MAVFRARALVVATGVPLAFAVLATVLAVGSAGASATGRPVASASPSPAPTDDAFPDAPGWSVRRDLVRSSVPAMPVPSRVRTTDPVVFITVDDGVTKSPAALRLVESRRVPVTAFLTTWTIKDSARYFTRLTRWGSVQNHSATHARLADSSTDLDHEICYSQRVLARDFGVRPWLMRPPYGVGAGRMEVQATAQRCGIQQLVLWDAVVDGGRLSRPGGALRAGDIVLLHFTPRLARDLRVALQAAQRAGLTPASLADYLPAA